MDPVISDMVERYERGRLSRRDLVAGLSALAAAGTTGVARAQQAAPTPLIPNAIDHVSILTGDLQGSADFYNRVFGLETVSEDAENKIVRLGPPGAGANPDAFAGGVLVSLREEPPEGVVDHWAFRIEGLDRAAAYETLQSHGLTPDNNIEYGFHVRDPNGVVVQMV